MDVIQLETPFHLRMLGFLREELNLDNCIIFHSSYIDEGKIIQLLPRAILVTLEPNNLRFKEILFLKGIKDSRAYFNALVSLISNDLKAIKISRYICFNDRNLFSQILYKKKKINQVILIDEGTELYQKKQKTSIIKSFLYPICTPIIFKGFNFKYYYAMGLHPITNIIYARKPDEIPNKRKYVLYKKITINKSIGNKHIEFNNTNILLITSPGYEDRLIKENIELEFVHEILKILYNKGYTISIKLHPREKANKYNFISKYHCKELNQSMPSEDIDYFEYSYIINFFSSAVLDIEERNYPLNRILTLKQYSFSDSVDALFNKTVIINNLNELKSILIPVKQQL